MSVQELSEKSSLLEQRHFPVDPPWRDLWASVLFGFHLCALLALTIYGSLLPAVPYVNGSGFWLVNWLASLHGRHFVFVLLLLGCSSCISLCWGLFLIALLRGSALAVIYISCIFSICFALAMTIYWFVVGPIYVAVVSLLLLLGTVLFLVFGFKRIPFTAILLSTVSVICKQYPGLLFQNLVSSLFWLCYLGLFIAASVFSARIVVLQGWHLIPLLLAFFWTQQVTQNFAHVTASGIVGCWYFREQNENPTLGALYRAATSSFGSICFGSLIVGLIKTFDAVCRMLLMANHEIISFFVRLLLSLIGNIFFFFFFFFLSLTLVNEERLVEWFNTYAFTYCAIYGLGYVESAKRSWKLLLRRFGSAIINDSLVI